MRRHRLSNLPCSQTIAALPFKRGASLATVFFDLRLIGSLKNILPAEVNSFTVVSDVHDSFAHERFFGLRIDALKDFAIVGNRRGSSFFRRLLTVEPDLGGPVVRVGHLVMQRDMLIGRILSGRIYIPAYFNAWSSTLLIVQQLRRYCSRKRFKSFHAFHIKSAKQDASVLEQLLFNPLPVQ